MSNWTPGPEALIQKAIIEAAFYKLRGVLCHHSDAGSPTAARRRYLSWLGAKPGFPDLLFVDALFKDPDELVEKVRVLRALMELGISAPVMAAIRAALDGPKLLAMEVKSKTGTVTLKQRAMIALLRSFGVPVFVVRSVAEAGGWMAGGRMAQVSERSQQPPCARNPEALGQCSWLVAVVSEPHRRVDRCDRCGWTRTREFKISRARGMKSYGLWSDWKYAPPAD